MTDVKNSKADRFTYTDPKQFTILKKGGKTSGLDPQKKAK